MRRAALTVSSLLLLSDIVLRKSQLQLPKMIWSAIIVKKISEMLCGLGFFSSVNSNNKKIIQ